MVRVVLLVVVGGRPALLWSDWVVPVTWQPVVVAVDVMVGVLWRRKHERQRGNGCHVAGICEGPDGLVLTESLAF